MEKLTKEQKLEMVSKAIDKGADIDIWLHGTRSFHDADKLMKEVVGNEVNSSDRISYENNLIKYMDDFKFEVYCLHIRDDSL